MWNGAMRALPLKEQLRAAAQVPDGMSLAYDGLNNHRAPWGRRVSY
jgi:hypothetical protein